MLLGLGTLNGETHSSTPAGRFQQQLKDREQQQLLSRMLVLKLQFCLFQRFGLLSLSLFFLSQTSQR